MKKFTLYWFDGKREIVTGTDAANAMNNAGYGYGALRALDFWAHGECTDYVWDKKTGWSLTEEARIRKFGN
jgi:hypothetical protein